MAKSGRLIRISRGGVDVVGARTDSVTFNSEPIDITDKDDSGWQTLLADTALRSLSCEVEGVMKDSTLAAASVGTSTALLAASIATITGIGTFAGNFHLNNFAPGGELDGAITFSATLESGGAITATIGPYPTVAPSMSGGFTDTDTITAGQGTWVGDATITLGNVWQRGNTALENDPSWVAIAGETASTYVCATADIGKYIRLQVTATNSVGATVGLSPASLVSA